MGNLAIETNNLSKIYKAKKQNTGDITALNSINLSIEKGSIFGLLGSNGAGKSTFINILAGITVKTSGKVNISGLDQDKSPRETRSAIGIVLQEIGVDPFMSPRELLETNAGMYGVPKSERRTEEILSKLDLYEKADSYTRSLSGGMKRRLMIAKALAHSPSIVILDEPSAGVDIALRKKLWSLIRDLNDSGITIILTTHYLEEAQEMCDNIAIIDKGKLITSQSKASLMKSIDVRFVILFFENPVTHIPQALEQHPDLKAKITPEGDVKICYNCSKGMTALEILNMAKNEGMGLIKDFATKDTSLEDIFLDLTDGANY